MSSQQQPNRDWEHWPGRRDPDEGIRHRLLGLFTHTGSAAGPEAEELIAAHGRELELRTRQLAATVADLQQREERARELRTAVEELLRHGSSELDDRHTELNALASDLARREEALTAVEADLADRRRELGAVELRRAALERREAAANEREAALERIAAELQEREGHLRSTPVTTAVGSEPGDDDADAGHLVFSFGERYSLQERAGTAPRPGTTVELETGRGVVLGVGASPLPGDRRRCAFVELLRPQ